MRRAPSSPSRCTNTSVDALRAEVCHVETGVFGARMEVALVNDGPVTIVLDV